MIVCPMPWRAMKATWTPDGRLAMVMGELGKPHGWETVGAIRCGVERGA